MAKSMPTTIRNAEAKWSPHWATLDHIPEAAVALNQSSRAHSCVTTISFGNHEYHNALIGGIPSTHYAKPQIHYAWAQSGSSILPPTRHPLTLEMQRKMAITDRNSRPSINALHSGKSTLKLRNLEYFAKFGAKSIRAHITPNLSYTMDSSVWKSRPPR